MKKQIIITFFSDSMFYGTVKFREFMKNISTAFSIFTSFW